VSRRRSWFIASFLLAFALGGCSATNQLVNEWRNPAYSSARFKRIFVSGPDGATSVRRNFEDEFVAQLRAAGADAIPSYRRMAEDERVDESSVKEAAQKAGADAALFARSVQVERKTEYGPSYYPSPWFGVYGPYGGVSWYGYYGAPTVYHYNEYTSETTLYDVAKDEIVWSATIKTTDPQDITAAIKTYIAAIIQALKEKNLLGNPSEGF
jgi:hypothetical protein